MPPALPLVRVVGASGSGKTTAATALVRALRERGYVVGVVKHSHHGLPADRPGADTQRYTEAGAAGVVFAAPDGALTRWTEGEPSLEEATRVFLGRTDLVVVEGYHEAVRGPTLRPQGGPGQEVELWSAEGVRLAAEPVAAVGPVVEALERLFELSAEGGAPLRAWIRQAAAQHGHACPGQVLGVRMALAGLEALGLEAGASKGLDVTVEIDRCATDAIGAVTGCSPGKRSLRVLDYGKMAATFQDTESGRAVRVLAREEAREAVAAWAPAGLRPQHQQSIAYRRMATGDLFTVEPVERPLPDRSRPARVACGRCEETVNFGRYVVGPTGPVCLPCAAAEA